MWIRDGYGQKAWLDEEQAEHLRANGHKIDEWEDDLCDKLGDEVFAPAAKKVAEKIEEYILEAALTEEPGKRKGWPKGKLRGKRDQEAGGRGI